MRWKFFFPLILAFVTMLMLWPISALATIHGPAPCATAININTATVPLDVGACPIATAIHKTNLTNCSCFMTAGPEGNRLKCLVCAAIVPIPLSKRYLDGATPARPIVMGLYVGNRTSSEMEVASRLCLKLPIHRLAGNHDASTNVNPFIYMVSAKADFAHGASTA